MLPSASSVIFFLLKCGAGRVLVTSELMWHKSSGHARLQEGERCVASAHRVGVKNGRRVVG